MTQNKSNGKVFIQDNISRNLNNVFYALRKATQKNIQSMKNQAEYEYKQMNNQYTYE